MPRSGDAKVWNPDLERALQCRWYNAVKAGSPRHMVWQRGEEAIRAVPGEIYQFSTGRIVGLPKDLSTTVHAECRAIINGQREIIPDGMSDPQAPGYMRQHPYLKGMHFRTGGYALLLAFHHHPKSHGFHSRSELIRDAQPYCDEEMAPDHFAGRITTAGWDSIWSLERYRLVQCCCMSAAQWCQDDELLAIARQRERDGVRGRQDDAFVLTRYGQEFIQAMLDKWEDARTARHWSGAHAAPSAAAASAAAASPAVRSGQSAHCGMASLNTSLYSYCCRYLGAGEVLALASTCTAARNEWLPAGDPLWWAALLRLASLEGDGIAETTATAEYITAKGALLRLGPLVLFRQHGVVDEGCIIDNGPFPFQANRDVPVPEVILGFMYVKTHPTQQSALRVLDPAVRIYTGTGADDESGHVIIGPGGSAWQVKNAAPGLWLISVRRRQIHSRQWDAGDVTQHVCKYLCGFHDSVLSVSLPRWDSQDRTALQKLFPGDSQASQPPTATVEGGMALGVRGNPISVLSERPEAFYLHKYGWRPTMLPLVDRAHLWFDTIKVQLKERLVVPAKKGHGKRKKQKTGAARRYPCGPHLVVGWHLQVGGAPWEGD
jgi:hypothetical protein